MSDDALPGLPPETHIMIAGPIGWAGGYVIRCRECGAADGWRLSVYPGGGPVDAPGDDADLTCSSGHTQRHPLVYPDMVWAAWSSRHGDAFTGEQVSAALRAINWRPHNRVIRHGAPRYFSWEYEPGPDETAWPDLTWVWQGGALPRPPAAPKPASRRRSLIFMDWGGVLSSDEYWLSLRGNGHPLKARVDAGMERIWHTSPGVSQAWMQGETAFGEVLAAMGLEDEDPGALERALKEDCRRMRVDPGIARLLPGWFAPPGTELILASDNTPQFAEAFHAACEAGKRGTEPPATMADAAPWFSWTAFSCDVGCLKADDPGWFFGPALRTFGRWFDDALLIDDRADVCKAFTAMGGTAVRWHLGDDVRDLEEPVRNWLARP